MIALPTPQDSPALHPAWLPMAAQARRFVLQVRPTLPDADPPPAAAPWREALALVEKHLPITRRIVHSGDSVYCDGEPCTLLHIVNSGMVRTVRSSSDGREQVVGLHFKGDWLGLDGIASGYFGRDAIAIDIGEVWTLRYDILLRRCTAVPALLALMLGAMSRQIVRDGDSLLSLGTLPADARVADFLRFWAESLRERELRADHIVLRMSRAEIGNALGMTLESVSRALTRMARVGVVCFNEKGRRHISIPSLDALGEFIKDAAAPSPAAVGGSRAAPAQRVAAAW